jgi:hypothetical protein
MLDNDHIHPTAVVRDLVTCGKRGVVIGLAKRRGPPHDFVAWQRGPDGKGSVPISGWTRGDVIPIVAGGMGAIAIQRWVFDAISENGAKKPWFRYHYEDDNMSMPTEDLYFMAACEQAGVPMWCHTGVYSPHCLMTAV